MYKKVIHCCESNLFSKWQWDHVIEYSDDGHTLRQYNINKKCVYTLGKVCGKIVSMV